jgi:glycine cleavage system H protein
MKEIQDIILPEDLFYSEDHEWAKREGDQVLVGITDFAQDQMGEIVFVELPQAGDRFERGQQFGTIESVKAVVEVYMPLGGEVTAANEALSDSPELVNRDPYGKGYMIAVRPDGSDGLDALLGRGAYLELLKGREE